jgi:hypothetical protein
MKILSFHGPPKNCYRTINKVHLYSHGHGISSAVVIQLTLAVKQVLYISNPTLEFLTWMSMLPHLV